MPHCLKCSGLGSVYRFTEVDDPAPDEFWKPIDLCPVCFGEGVAMQTFDEWWNAQKLGGLMNDVIMPEHVRSAYELGRIHERDECHKLARSFAVEPGDFDAATAETIASSIACRTLDEARNK